MNQTTSLLCYNAEPIRSIAALAKAVAFSGSDLLELARSANGRYRLAKAKVKPDGSIRQPFDALDPLKEVHRRIKNRILTKVSFPFYLTGSVRHGDYRVNAQLHAGKAIVVCEDIERFFPTTTYHVVFDIWRNFFQFSGDVAEVLTQLTCKDSRLPEGSITSSYLANLAFWRFEPILQRLLAEQDICYSRYVDDITFSSGKPISKENLTDVIGQIYGMLRKHGYKAKRRKHEVFTPTRRMFVTKVLVNARAALTQEERAKIRAAVYQFGKRIVAGERGQKIEEELRRLAGRVGKLSRFHPNEGARLAARVAAFRQLLN